MKQHTTVVHRMVLEYDDEKMTEHEAQEVVLQGFPESIATPGLPSVLIYYVERTHGGVNQDGVPVQPRPPSWPELRAERKA